MRAGVLALVLPLAGCGYDFARFEQRAPSSDARMQDGLGEAPDADADAGVEGGVVDSGRDASFDGNVASWPDAAGSCTSAYEPTKGRWFVVCQPADGTTPYNLARSYCRGQGLDLASIDDQATNDFVQRTIIAASGAGIHVWIGLRVSPGDADAALPVPGAYWVDDAALGYTNWSPGQPRAVEGTTDWSQSCGLMRGGDGLWEVYLCAYASYWFVCGTP